MGLTFEELVERLLDPALGNPSPKFSVAFLCLYRQFAPPSQLFAEIWRRFERLQITDHPQLLRTSCQFRYLETLTLWLSEYPGDFAHPFLKSQMGIFLDKLRASRIFEAVAAEMDSLLSLVDEDDDTSWAHSDEMVGCKKVLLCFSRVPSLNSIMMATMADTDRQNQVWNGSEDFQKVQERSPVRSPKTDSQHSSSNQSIAGSRLANFTALASVAAAQRQAQLLTPRSRFPLSKIQWHQFMEISDEDIARELTRIDWILYSSIRPRDLIRQISLVEGQTVHYSSTEYVSKMINQFNHVAFWVANMILLRDKAKHRAKMLEKFMSIAWVSCDPVSCKKSIHCKQKLRHLNNYNGLGALVAGINGMAIHRLAQTRGLVSSSTQKDFMRLEILMSTHKSHFAYRLAWENTSAARIPFLPLHRRDLVMVEEGNRTFLGPETDRINWKKFEMMGEVVAGIRQSQGYPYPHIHQSTEVQHLVLDSRFSRDEDVSRP